MLDYKVLKKITISPKAYSDINIEITHSNRRDVKVTPVTLTKEPLYIIYIL